MAHRPSKRHNGWDFSEFGPTTYIHDEPYMSVDEYQSYRFMWLHAFGNHAECEPMLCHLTRYQPPGSRPNTVRQV